jgi:hypothetical protein
MPTAVYVAALCSNIFLVLISSTAAGKILPTLRSIKEGVLLKLILTARLGISF